MATILLDDTLIQDVLEDRKGRALLLKRLLEDGHLLACCAPTVAEMLKFTAAGARHGGPVPCSTAWSICR